MRMRFPTLLLLGRGAPAAAADGWSASDRQIAGRAAAGQHLHAEVEVEFPRGSVGQTVAVTSDVPVTIQRYSDAGRFLQGREPREWRSGGRRCAGTLGADGDAARADPDAGADVGSRAPPPAGWVSGGGASGAWRREALLSWVWPPVSSLRRVFCLCFRQTRMSCSFPSIVDRSRRPTLRGTTSPSESGTVAWTCCR